MGEKPEDPEKISNGKLYPHITLDPGIEPGPDCLYSHHFDDPALHYKLQLG